MRETANSETCSSNRRTRFAYRVRPLRHHAQGIFQVLAISFVLISARELHALGPCSADTSREAWWTGPIAAPSAATLPRGHVLIEPYIYDTRIRGAYDNSGNLDTSSRGNNVGTLVYTLYGIADRLSAGLIYAMELEGHRQGEQSVVGGGDPSLVLQYRLTQPKRCHSKPTLSVNAQESFPLGQYDHLANNQQNEVGSGVFTTTLAAYSQTSFWMLNGHVLRVRLNGSLSLPSSAMVTGRSVYGTPPNFSGFVAPGRGVVVDLAAEYGLTRNWVFASDLLFRRQGETLLMGVSGCLPPGSTKCSSVIDGGFSIAVVPAVEYNFSASFGIIAGVKLTTSGTNTNATAGAIVAFNFMR